ncbi:hypothetical protein D3C78_1767720 [compost metagenome]
MRIRAFTAFTRSAIAGFVLFTRMEKPACRRMLRSDSLAFLLLELAPEASGNI